MFSPKLLKTLSISAVVGLATNAHAQTTAAPTVPAAASTSSPVPTPLPAGKAAQMPTPPAPGSVSMPMPPVGGAGTMSPTPLPAGTPAPFPAPLNSSKAGSELKPLNNAKASAKAAATKTSDAKAETFPATVTELISRDRSVGTGDAAVSGQAVAVQYTGWIYDPSKPDGKGAKFDSSRDHPPLPFSFMLGAGRVIKGWDQGVAGMKPKGTRTLIIPPQMAYGERNVGPIPPNSTLIFDVELVDILSPAPKAAAPTPAPASAPAPASK